VVSVERISEPEGEDDAEMIEDDIDAAEATPNEE
jgi:hypothetical protein